MRDRPAWQRVITIFAGPGTNYLSAIVLAFALYTCHGMHSDYRWYGVAAVKADYDAAGKLQVNDRILAVDGVPLMAKGVRALPSGQLAKEDSLVKRVNAKSGAPVFLTIDRGGMQLIVSIQPKVAKDSEGKIQKSDDGRPLYLLGIVPFDQPDVLDVGIFGAAAGAIEFPIDQTKLIAVGLYSIITGKEKADPGGPKRIFDEFAKAWQLGIVTGIQLLMMLSVYLGLFNLLPLPALDGGRLVFLTYELVTRRRANPKIEAMVHMAGIMVLGVVMILVTLHDFHWL